MSKLDELKAQKKAIEAEIKRLETAEYVKGNVKLNSLNKDYEANDKILSIRKKTYWEDKEQRWSKIIEARNWGQMILAINTLIGELRQVKDAIIAETGEQE